MATPSPHSALPISVIIVSWNVKNQLRECLKSIYQSDQLPESVIVVDNASTDDSADEVRRQFPVVHLVTNQNNRGFAAAVNQGLSLKRADFYLILNPDCLLGKNTLSICHRLLSADPSIGILGCLTKNSDGAFQPTTRCFPRLADQWLIALSLHRLFPNSQPIRHYFMSDFNGSNSRDVDQIQGSFFMLSSTALVKVGLFDERFFVWFEEVDYCLRVKRAGYHVAFTNQTSIVHQGAASFSQLTPLKKRWLFMRSLIQYFIKHKPVGQTLVLIMLWPFSLLTGLVITLIKPDSK